ncbi:hypothetical protein VPH35_045758 [Triticum aestivum]
MKWKPFMSTFVLNKMRELISSGLGLQGLQGGALEHRCEAGVRVLWAGGVSTQVYNHLRNWRGRWIQVSKLRDISGASWNENTCSIVLEAEHYASHVAPFVKLFDKPFDPVHDRKRKRGGLMEEEINVFYIMTEAVKEVATTIRECKPLDVHPDLYGAVMT